jgi:hypothetical protein
MVHKTSRKNRKSSRRTKKSLRITKKYKGGVDGPYAMNQAPVVGSNPSMNTENVQGNPAQILPDSQDKCEIFDTQFTSKSNNIWKTCITVNKKPTPMIYMTPKNVLIKSVETIQIPEFTIDISNSIGNHVIRIEDKYVGCFVYLNNSWYAIMRLFGTTVNTHYFARTEKNKVFYRLDGIGVDMNVANNTGTGAIKLSDNMYNKDFIKTLLGNKNTPTITLTGGFTNINKDNGAQGHIFTSLQAFRQQKLLGNDAKQDAAFAAVDGAAGTEFSIFSTFASYFT